MPDTIPELVSTVIPVYNRPKMLREAVESVLGQTYRPIEIIIVDDGSTDHTSHVAEALAKSNPDLIRVVHQPNHGPSAAREAGRQILRGEFVQYLDSDDLLRPRKFEIQVQALKANPHCGAAYGYICFHPSEGPAWKEPFKGSGTTRETLFPWILIDRWWNTDAPLFRRSVCDAAGPWAKLRIGEDWEYDARIGSLGTRLVHCREFVCDQRQHAGLHITSNVDRMAADELQNTVCLLQLLFQHALAAGVGPETPERQKFARWSFMVARRCAAVGLAEDTKRCLDLALRAAADCQDARRGVRQFRLMKKILGNRLAGKMAMYLEAFRTPFGTGGSMPSIVCQVFHC